MEHLNGQIVCAEIPHFLPMKVPSSSCLSRPFPSAHGPGPCGVEKQFTLAWLVALVPWRSGSFFQGKSHVFWPMNTWRFPKNGDSPKSLKAMVLRFWIIFWWGDVLVYTATNNWDVMETGVRGMSGVSKPQKRIRAGLAGYGYDFKLFCLILNTRCGNFRWNGSFC